MKRVALTPLLMVLLLASGCQLVPKGETRTRILLDVNTASAGYCMAGREADKVAERAANVVKVARDIKSIATNATTVSQLRQAITDLGLRYAKISEEDRLLAEFVGNLVVNRIKWYFGVDDLTLIEATQFADVRAFVADVCTAAEEGAAPYLKR